MHPTAIKDFLRRLVAPIDPPLMTIMVLLIALGLVVLASATNDSPARMSGQVINLCIALVLMRGVAQVPPQTLMRLAPPIYVGGIVLLVAVALLGEVSKGARRWLDIGVTRIQPSEVMKIAMPLMLAWYFHKREAALKLRDYIVGAVLLAGPVALIAKQPDLGTSMLVLAAGLYVIFLAGLSWKLIFGLLVAALASMPLVWSMLHDYQRNRILTLIDPEQDPLGKGFHIIQSTIAVGSGGIAGKGWMHGTQTHLEFLPERHTDFVFAVLAEEFGLIGSVVLVTLYALLTARGLMIAASAPTFFSRLIAGSITLTLFTYSVVNMGMVSGMLPVVGVPLPFVSYGGTALATLCLGIGILMSVSRNRRLLQK